MRTFVLLFILLFPCCIKASEIDLDTHDAVEYQAITMTKELFDKIIKQGTISKNDENRFFGKNGGILGESLYDSLGYGNDPITFGAKTRTISLVWE